MKRLAIITTHPIQYYAPVFKILADRKKIAVKVFYTWGKAALNKFDPGFGKEINWDIPLLDGYDYELLANTAADPGSHHFKGIINPDLISRIERYQADAVLLIGWAFAGHLKAIRYFHHKIPVYFRGDSNLIDQRSRFKDFLKTYVLKWVYSHIDHAFYVGTNNLAYYKKYGLADKQLTFAPHAIDNVRFSANRTKDAKALRQSFGLKSDDILILFAGKFEEKKSPMLLLQAFNQLNEPTAHLLFAGNGPLEAQLKSEAAANKNIHFSSFVNQTDMPVIYQACDLFCLPSQGPNETWGLAVNEAMACSKPVLVSDKCGCAADLVTQTNGLIFTAGDSEELMLGLKTLIADRAKLIRMGNHSHEIIKDWSFINVASAIENQLLNEKN